MILWTFVTKSRPMFWDCFWSWHFIVVFNKCVGSIKMVLPYHCLRINIHEIIHVKLNSAVMMKPLQLCIFIHNFYCSVSVFYFYMPYVLDRILCIKNCWYCLRSDYIKRISLVIFTPYYYPSPPSWELMSNSMSSLCIIP